MTGAFEGAYTYKMHWQGAQHFFSGVDVPHKHLLVTPPAHAERPFHQWHDEIIRWYDHWLKGVDNGVENDPAVRVWIMGENKWREFDGWPVPETRWSEYYLHSWEKLEHERSSAGRPDLRQRAAGRLRRRCRRRRPTRSSGCAT